MFLSVLQKHCENSGLGVVGVLQECECQTALMSTNIRERYLCAMTSVPCSTTKPHLQTVVEFYVHILLIDTVETGVY